VQGPQCGNIQLDAAYRSIETVPTVVGVLDTEGAPACARVTYTVYVYSPDGTTQIASLPVSTADLGSDFAIPLPGVGSQVCVYAESTNGPHVIDRAPDQGCAAFGEPLVLTTGAGATSFR
jgi:hypothetical protein